MQTVKGDLIDLALRGHFDVIVHGCNCLCSMGAGIAKSIAGEFPEARLADLKTVKGDRTKLGTYSAASVKRNGHNLTVVNAYIQYNYRGRGVLVDYQALQQVFLEIAHDFEGLRIAYPKIGAGLAKGDWDQISRIIDRALTGEKHTLVEYTP